MLLRAVTSRWHECKHGCNLFASRSINQMNACHAKKKRAELRGSIWFSDKFRTRNTFCVLIVGLLGVVTVIADTALIIRFVVCIYGSLQEAAMVVAMTRLHVWWLRWWVGGWWWGGDLVRGGGGEGGRVGNKSIYILYVIS